jgi:hypothetical protein
MWYIAIADFVSLYYHERIIIFVFDQTERKKHEVIFIPYAFHFRSGHLNMSISNWIFNLLTVLNKQFGRIY